MEKSRASAITIVLNTFFMCIVAYFIEYKFFYSKSVSLFGTTIICKIFAIFAIFVAMHMLKAKWKSIGYIVKAKKIVSGIITPILIMSVCAIISFIIINLLIKSQGCNLEINYNSVFSTPNISSGYKSYILNIISILISVFMIETLLRGLVLQTINRYLKFYAANFIAVVLAVIWNNAIYIFNIIFNVITTNTFIYSIIFSTIIYATSAIRKSLYIRSSGAIWACLVDCFISIIVINNITLTVNLPPSFEPTGPIGYLVSFMSSSLTKSYASIIFMSIVSILSLVVMIIYCSILKKIARKKYLKRIGNNNATETN